MPATGSGFTTAPDLAQGEALPVSIIALLPTACAQQNDAPLAHYPADASGWLHDQRRLFVDAYHGHAWREHFQ